MSPFWPRHGQSVVESRSIVTNQMKQIYRIYFPLMLSIMLLLVTGQSSSGQIDDDVDESQPFTNEIYLPLLRNTAETNSTRRVTNDTITTSQFEGVVYLPLIQNTAGTSAHAILRADNNAELNTIGAAAFNCPCTIWDNNATPNVASENDTNAVEVGIKFQADVSGSITGIRFYKGSNNTGTHIGNLWSSSGQLLASATFVNETASGWQQVDFATPVAISANTTYVASYHTTVGYYAVDEGYFGTGGVANGPLRALEDGVDGGNGVYRYGASAFPTDAYNASNFWVDVVFAEGPDTEAPTVTTVTPNAGAFEVAPESNITITFDEPMDPATINATTIELRDAANSIVAATVTYDSSSQTATLDPTAPLATSAFTVTVKGGTTDPRVKDVAENALAADFRWSFTTEACSTINNRIVCENAKPGNPASEWDISGAGDPSIQGFTTDISVNLGETVRFKIDTDATDYRLDIYRMGYYGGLGARKIATVQPAVSLPQNQPICLNDPTTGLIDCGNWGESASWSVPVTATSGIYFAKAIRTDSNGASHIAFIVRDDNGGSEMLFQTADTTWQAYNDYGGNSLYVGAPAGRAYKVSYNRPFVTRQAYPEDWVFNAEYPMVRWLEANGYDVSYFTGIDSHRRGAEILEHELFLSVGHDEYWSATQRANVEAARNAGVNLAFFSGNEMFWKTRWENSIDGSGTPYRTLVAYKETLDSAKIDPLPNVWTGTWRDPRFSPPADGGNPENALTGTMFKVNIGTYAIQVPEADGKMRFWRNTTVANLQPGQTATLSDFTLGYEWDEDPDNDFRPPGLIRLSSTSVNDAIILVDNGATYEEGSATHNLTLYRHSSGALVFGAGTVQWSWGLDGNHDRLSSTPDIRMQQATINLFADMGVQPLTLQSGLTSATQSTDTSAPTTAIASPLNGTTVQSGTVVSLVGTASDSGGVVGGVEVSVNGGTTWRRADGRANWSYSWTANALGAITIMARAADDSANLGNATSITINVTDAPDTEAPTVTVTEPTSGAIISGTIAVSATATDNFGVVGVQFQLDGVNLGNEDTVAPYTIDWNTATTTNGAHTLTAIARDAAGNSGTSASVVITVANPVDTTPPTVTATNPVDGATNVDPSGVVTMTFSEAMDPATIDGTTIELRDSGNNLVAATVTYNATNQRATLTPTAALAYGTGYTALVRGGATDPRVKDLAGNALANDVIWSFTTEFAPGTNCPCTIWSPTDAPVNPAENDANAVEVGVKFQADMDGTITGIRFYKGSGNTGTHIGNLWTANGQLLGSATFVNETATGWQQVDFTAPIAINANVTYIASYHSEVGFYAQDANYFATEVNSAPLRALADGAANGNGVYRYGPSAFPAQSAGASNYWVDVVFTPSIGPDTNPPLVIGNSPATGATGVLRNANVTATFNEPIDPTTISGSTVELRDNASNLVASVVTYNSEARTFTLDPTEPLAYGTTFTMRIRGGTTDPRVKDVAGNALATDFTWSFTTEDAPPIPPDDGPGGPVLIISTATNPFSRYYTEILRAEGLNLFLATDISFVSAGMLAAYDVVILGEMPLSPSQLTMFTDWVNSGGNLIAMRPDKQLAGLLGLADAAATLAEGYMLVNTAAQPGTGIVGETMQYHGTADLYTLAGATQVATLYSNATTPATNNAPAVTLRSVGANGGQVAAFVYDLARSIIYTRQGNPNWDGQERDNLLPIRSNDLFFGNAIGDPQADWVDLNKVAIPQADEQQRLLANLILQMNTDRKPLPRFWYFPDDHKAVVVMTGDDHGIGLTKAHFDQFQQMSIQGCSVADWECVRGTSYIYTNTPLTAAEAAAYDAAGFEVALHISTGCTNYTPASIDGDYSSQLPAFGAKYSTIPAPVTNRTHCIAWSDWATQAIVEQQYGIRLDTNYYYFPGTWVNGRDGFFTGSGMPMRFAKLDGTIIDVYQAATQMTDESLQIYPDTADVLLDRALGPEGYYGAFTANIHTDRPVDDAVAIVQSAQARGVPVISARQLLEWTDGRNGSAFSGLTWDGTTLSFSISVASGANNLQAMLPTQIGGSTITSINHNGTPIAFSTQIVKGVSYAIFSANAGLYQASSTVIPPDTEAPTVALTNPTAGATVTGTVPVVANATDNVGVVGVQFQLNGANLGLEDFAAPYTVNWNTTTIANGTYQLTAIARDLAGNNATSTMVNVTVDNIPDTTPPTVTAVVPTPGAIDLAVDTDVTVTFSEPMDPTSIDTNSIQLLDGANNPVAVAVTYNATNRTATVNPTASLLSATTYTVVVRGGVVEPHVKDVAGNALVTDFVSSFTTATAPPYTSIWDNTTVPAVASENDPSAVEVGVKFQSESAGYIVGIRFYKGPSNTGVHIGNLWDSSGQLLATATFANETATGWQQVYFANPVALAANTTYVASYHTSSGYYALNSGYFAGGDFANPPLRALADGESGSNGVYGYGPSAFPTQSFSASNYWVDVLFGTEVVPDTTPPTVAMSSPTNDAEVAGTVNISANASDNIGVVGVQFRLNGNNLGAEDTVAPYTLAWDTLSVANGGYQLTAVARDSAGNTTTSAPINVTVNNVADTTPPTVVSLTPANAAVNVVLSTTVTVNVSEALDPATVNGTTFVLRDVNNGVVPATVSYNGATVVTVTPNALLAHDTVYTLTILGGVTDPRMKDLAGNALAADFVSSFTTVAAPGANCPCSIWDGSATPAIPAANDPSAVEVGVKFRADIPGYITGIRFYKGAGNSGTHIGNLWDSNGQLLATATFLNETATGWQQVNFASPVAIAANTTYVASYHTSSGFYAVDSGYFAASVTNAPLRALADGVDGANGVYSYGPSTFPTSSFNASNYWVDVVFALDAPPDTTPPTVIGITPVSAALDVAIDATVTVNVSEALDPATVNGTTFVLRDATNSVISATVSYNGATVVTVTPNALLAYDTAYTLTILGGATDPRVKDLAGNALVTDFVSSFTTVAAPGANCPCSIWDGSATPAIPAVNDPSAVEVGVKFRADIPGYITGIRFYKGSGNDGTHIGNLWDSSGQLLATATFLNETATGWQQVNFANPVAIAANTTYVASYHTSSGFYAVDSGYFATGVTNTPLRALADGVDGTNGVYSYGPSAFPTSSFNASNYWVDVVFALDAPADTTPPTVTLLYPTADATLSGTVTISATAADNVAVAGVQFLVDGVNFGAEETTPPYAIAWDTTSAANGAHTVSAIARDGAGNTTTASALNVTIANDQIAPSVVAVTPTSGTIDVALTASVTVTFSEALDPATVNETTLILRDAVNNTVTVTVSYNLATQSATVTPINPLSNSTVYTLTILGGGVDPRVKDLAGNALAANFATSFTTVAVTEANCPCSIWDESATPTTPAANDPSAIEVGVKFRSDIPGYITGIRFYKGVGNTGPHIGNLWDSSGQLLATATFVNETATGWQQVDFASPVAIAAGTTYVASYHTASGFYGVDSTYFAFTGVDRPPLHALANDVDGPNGLYQYGPSAFPTQSFNAANYWVDVVFEISQ